MNPPRFSSFWQEVARPFGCPLFAFAKARGMGDAGFALSTGGFPRGVTRLGQHTAVGISQLAERQQRDLTDGQVHIYDEHWQLQQQWTLPGEGLVLDIQPCP